MNNNGHACQPSGQSVSVVLFAGAVCRRDHLLSTAVTTNSSGATSGDHRYCAYGRYRGGGELLTEQNFTSQKLDASGLIYYNSRYYDPELGAFLSPDTLVPDPTNLFDYNRLMYVRGNPLRFNDPDGRTPWDVVDLVFWALSARDMYNDPSWGNAGWLAVDTLTMLPIIPSIGGWIRRGPEAVRITNASRKLVAMHGVDVAIEFTHVAHKPGAETLLYKLISGADTTVKGAFFELEYARKYTDEIVEIGRKLNPIDNAEIDFVLENNVFVNVKNYDWSKYNPFVTAQETERLVRQATSYLQYNPTAVKYVFKGSVPESVRKALEKAGIIVEVVQ